MADRSVIYRLQADVSGFQAQMAQASASTKKLATDLTALDQNGAKMRAGLTTFGNAAGKAGLVAAAGLGATVKAAMDWETAWTGVLKTVDGTPEQLARLEGGLRKLAVETGFAHEEVAAVAEAAGQLGISTGGVRDFTRTMLDMGVSTSMSSEEAATGLARLRNIMGSTEGEIRNTGSAMVELGNNFATTEGEILAMSQRIAGAGRQAGLSTADVLGLSAAMSSVGIEAEAGGTAISLTMKRIGKEVETGGDKLDLFAETAGMTVEEFAQAWGDDAAGTLTKFVAGLGKAESMGRSTNAVLRQLGVTGIREADALLRLSGNAEGLAAAFETSSEAFRENNALTEESGKFYETSAQQAKQAWVEIKDAAIDAGAAMLPVVTGISTAVSAVAGAFQSLPDPIKGATGPLLAVTAILGGSVWAGAKVVNGIAGMRGAMANLGTSATGLGANLGSTAKSFKGFGTNLGIVTRNMLTAGAASERMRAQTQAALVPLKAQGKAVAGFAGQAALLGVVATGAADKMGLANTASLALAGSLAGHAGMAIGAGAGALMDLSAAGSEAHDSMVALNAAVESNNINDITAAIERQKVALEDYSNVDWTSLGDLFESVGSAIGDTFRGDFTNTTAQQEKAIEAAKKHKVALQDAAEGSRQLDVAMARSAESAEAQRRALQETSEAASKTAGSFMAFGDSLDDSEVSLGAWIAEMERSAAALANFTANSRKAAKRGLDDGLIASLQEAGPAGAMRMQQLADASQKEIGRANRAWRKGEDAIGEYIHMVNGVPSKKATYLELADQAAKDALADFQAKVDHATRRRIIVIDVQGRMPRTGQWGISADGGSVPKTGLPYADRHPYLLADGEEVISNRRGQADKNRHALKAANAGATIAVVGYADGGTVPRRPSRGEGVYVPPGPDRLDAAIAALAAAVQDQTEMLSNAEAARDEVLGRMQSLADATAALFDTPLFQQASDPWAAGAAGGPLGNIAGDIAGLEQRQLLQDQLKALGMEGDALAALLSQGSNADIAGMIARGEVDQYADLYRRRAALQESVGASAGEMAYGRDLAKLTPAVEAITTELQSMQGQLERMEKRAEKRGADRVEQFAHVINTGASRNARQGVGKK